MCILSVYPKVYNIFVKKLFISYVCALSYFKEKRDISIIVIIRMGWIGISLYVVLDGRKGL